MSWNHRIVKTEEILIIREVYYNKEGKPDMMNDGSIATGESMKELKASYKQLADAFKKPVLDDWTINNRSYNNESGQ